MISLLHEATGNDDTLLQEANPDLSEEALMQFKKRLRKVKNAIFNSRDSKLHYYFISGVNPRENKTQDYPVHKQPANEYLKRLMEYLSKEQREEIDLSKIFENELRADNRCKEIDLHTFLVELRHINVELNTKIGDPHR